MLPMQRHYFAEPIKLSYYVLGPPPSLCVTCMYVCVVFIILIIVSFGLFVPYRNIKCVRSK